MNGNWFVSKERQRMRSARRIRRLNRRAKKLGITTFEYITRVMLKEAQKWGR